jgi:hypothetical protein
LVLPGGALHTSFLQQRIDDAQETVGCIRFRDALAIGVQFARSA